MFVTAELDGGTIFYDVEDSADIEQHHWYVVQDGNKKYAYANVRVGSRATTMKMHRLVLGAAVGERVDHVNGDGLDNRRANLRLATAAQNQRNSGSRAGSSRFKGVYWHVGPGGRTPRWRAMIRIDGRRKSLGYFAFEEDAAHAYDEAALEHHGEFAQLNFPERQAAPVPKDESR